MPSRLWQPSRGSEDALSHAVAMVVTPLLLGLAGAGLDSRLGTAPWLMLVGAIFGAAGSFLSAYYRYEARIAEHDAGKPWTRAAQQRREAAEAERARVRLPSEQAAS